MHMHTYIVYNFIKFYSCHRKSRFQFRFNLDLVNSSYVVSLNFLIVKANIIVQPLH